MHVHSAQTKVTQHKSKVKLSPLLTCHHYSVQKSVILFVNTFVMGISGSGSALIKPNAKSTVHDTFNFLTQNISHCLLSQSQTRRQFSKVFQDLGSNFINSLISSQIPRRNFPYEFLIILLIQGEDFNRLVI